MNQRHRQRKRQRDHQRQQLQKALQGASLQIALEALAQESRRDKAELRGFKRAKAAQLTPLETRIQAADATIRRLRQQRKILSCELQEAMHRSYRLTNFAGQSLTVQALAGDSPLPTGTGDCCAPKLLHFAAEHGLEPLAMAEFWWGPDTADRRQGEFYGACAERCQPIMGFMLAGLSVKNNRGQVNANLSVPVLYEDEWLIVVDKPAGLLSVPGRYGHGQDSVLSRLRLLLPDGETLAAVHRLDRDTSGILVLARHQEAERLLRQQFQSRQVGKTYEALVDGYPTLPEGTITLPLRGNPADRPRQSVDWERGRPSTTRYRVIGQDGPVARIEFYPITGRTHQLRVHAAHAKGLNAPIVGDRLYGMANHRPRLCLHARELTLWHPHHGQALVLRTPTPF